MISIVKKIIVLIANIWVLGQIQAPNYEELQKLVIAAQDSIIIVQHEMIAALEAAVIAEQQLNSALLIIVGAIVTLSTALLIDDVLNLGKRIQKAVRKRYPP